MELWENNAASALAAAITSGDTSVTLEAGGAAGLPDVSGGDYFYLTLYAEIESVPVREIIKVTEITGDVLTVERAQQGTIALAWASGTSAENLITRQTLEDLRGLTTAELESLGYVRLVVGGLPLPHAEEGGSDPASGGVIRWNPTTSKYEGWNGTVWQPFAIDPGE